MRGKWSPDLPRHSWNWWRLVDSASRSLAPLHRLDGGRPPPPRDNIDDANMAAGASGGGRPPCWDRCNHSRWSPLWSGRGATWFIGSTHTHFARFTWLWGRTSKHGHNNLSGFSLNCHLKREQNWNVWWTLIESDNISEHARTRMEWNETIWPARVMPRPYKLAWKFGFARASSLFHSFALFRLPLGYFNQVSYFVVWWQER